MTRVGQFLTERRVAIGGVSLVAVAVLIAGTLTKIPLLDDSQVPAAKHHTVGKNHLQQVAASTQQTANASVLTTSGSADSHTVSSTGSTATDLTTSLPRPRFYGHPSPTPPILFKMMTISNPTNCNTFPVDAVLTANEDTVLTYHAEFTKGGRTTSQQLTFKKGDVKTVHVDMPYNVPATDRQISGVLTFVLESPDYRTDVTNLDPGLFNICNSYPDNPYNTQAQ